ncbi:hypothetical protein HPB50_015988 [Hyalomma asiaticum]|uniref:Uncharacterized protein n=1 Tax=Hyalomma asiaticum TaxID=266040 RepID=A0ACB7RLL4_HYAAI|nr:hypothetical protein HPB50_015988 [Hyalomma asiaticum]
MLSTVTEPLSSHDEVTECLKWSESKAVAESYAPLVDAVSLELEGLATVAVAQPDCKSAGVSVEKIRSPSDQDRLQFLQGTAANMADEGSHGNRRPLSKNTDKESSTSSEGSHDDSDTPLDLTCAVGLSRLVETRAVSSGAAANLTPADFPQGRERSLPSENIVLKTAAAPVLLSVFTCA